MLERRRYAEAPPRVKYALTVAGIDLLTPMLALGAWADRHGDFVRDAPYGEPEGASRRFAAFAGKLPATSPALSEHCVNARLTPVEAAVTCVKLPVPGVGPGSGDRTIHSVSVPQAVLLAVLAAVVGLAVGGLLIPYVNARQEQRRAATDSGLTMSQVLDLIVLASESGIAVVDQYRDVVLVNPRAEELGIVHDRLLDERAWSAVQQVLGGGKDIEFELTAKIPLPGRARLAVRGVARPLSQENPNFVVLFADDDSEQARMEATRRDFVANVSHELKTPVSAMSLLAEALLESADDPDSVRHFGERLHGEARRMGKMVTELIALSRLQGAEKLPELEAVDVDSVVTQAIERSRTAAEAAGITVSTDATSGLEVIGDQTLLVTALSNLVENAIAYSPRGSQVSVSRALRGGHVNIAVTDRGIGIGKEDQERVFERFFRADKARSRATGGTGLGLAIVKHVAANHSGEVTLWSKLGTGSTFTLRIPSHPADTNGIDKRLSAGLPAAKKETGPRPLGRARTNGVEATR